MIHWSSVLLIFGLTIAAVPALAGHPVTFCDVCPGYTISKKGDDLLIRCPGVAEPWLTVKDCKNPKAKRLGNSVTITCDNWGK